MLHHISSSSCIASRSLLLLAMTQLLSLSCAFQLCRLSVQSTRLYASKVEHDVKNIAIVGGGLAGMSTAYHLLEKIEGSSITIIDKADPGVGGASAVAGGLLHPFSPRGKLLHLGVEGLNAANKLIDAAKSHQPNCVLRDQLYRVALTEKNVDQLKDAADLYPKYATWVSPDEIESNCRPNSDSILGGVLFSNGCKVIHVPTYIQGLWSVCQDMSNGRATWCVEDSAIPKSNYDWEKRLSEFDAVVFAAGSGLFQDSILKKDAADFPAEIVRGQSIEFSYPSSSDYTNEALLCGKYFAPLPGSGRVLLGATHEWKEEALEHSTVMEELKQRSYDLAPFVWDEGSVQKITVGYRVQSRRGKFGRMPIIGKSVHNDIHPNSWMFTGLSGRGLIYHGVYGDILSDAIIAKTESVVLNDNPDALWWKP